MTTITQQGRQAVLTKITQLEAAAKAVDDAKAAVVSELTEHIEAHKAEVAEAEAHLARLGGEVAQSVAGYAGIVLSRKSFVATHWRLVVITAALMGLLAYAISR